MDEWEAIPLSRLSHAGYCLRRAVLLTNEQLWKENADTAKGREAHKRVHTNRIERRGDSLQLFEYDVFSKELNIGGKCDCIEAIRDDAGCRIPAAEFPVRLYPVEYKSGKLRDVNEYELQLCAQAMCLEEMYDTHIPEGAIFYISSLRRKTVVFTTELREQVRETVGQLEDIRRNYRIPPTESGPKCKRCSLRELCLPDAKCTAANAYFAVFDNMLDGKNGFVFNVRSKRPPRNEVNAVLSFVYTLLTHDCVSVWETVGLDPAAGYLHTLRPGRSSFALDLIEELRAPLCDRFVISLFHKGRLAKKDFNIEGDAVWLSEKGRRTVLSAWRERKLEEITHPFFKEKIPIGLIPYTQAMLFARVLRGDLDLYPPFVWR